MLLQFQNEFYLLKHTLKLSKILLRPDLDADATVMLLGNRLVRHDVISTSFAEENLKNYEWVSESAECRKVYGMLYRKFQLAGHLQKSL